MYRENNTFYQLFQGEPIELNWGGWRSNTYTLEREGWKFTADEYQDHEHMLHVVHLAATSPDKQVVIAGRMGIHREEFNYMHPYKNSWVGSLERRFLNMQQFTARDVFRVIDQRELNSWHGMKPIDIKTATAIAAKEVHYKFGNFKFFQQINTEPQNDIYIPSSSVDSLFNEILKIQYPQQQEIKKGLIMPEAKPIIKAQIYSLAV